MKVTMDPAIKVVTMSHWPKRSVTNSSTFNMRLSMIAEGRVALQVGTSTRCEGG